MLVLTFQALVAFSLFVLSLADPLDWANANYIISLRNRPTMQTQQAASAVIRMAGKTAKGGPWTVTSSRIRAPSGDPKDYFSWAPYRWPDCNKCASDDDDAANGADGEQENNDEDDDEQGAPKRQQVIPLRRRAHSNFTTTSLAMSTSAIFEPASVEPLVLARKPTPTPTCATRTKPATPEATWTTCPYIRRDGQVNPDVRSLNDSTFANKMSQSSVYNAIAYALTGDDAYSAVASSQLDTFFGNHRTGMNPNLKYGQTIRGPGKHEGSFMAILDLRGLVKVVNAVEILRQTGAPQWTYELDSRLVDWATAYIEWMRTSPIALKAAGSANNHGTFFTAQITSLHILVGDLASARQALRDYFSNLFPDQITASGDQPFESSRTRPSHYRSFNLEAMIANAKLADHLGLDAWRAVSRYKATIQTALDYTMQSAVRSSEGATALAEVAPHVAAIMAAYGDSGGKYSSWLKKYASDYQAKTWWLWDQPEAFAMSPVARQRYEQRQRGLAGVA